MYVGGNAQGKLAGVRFVRGTSFFFTVGKIMVNGVVEILGEPQNSRSPAKYFLTKIKNVYIFTEKDDHIHKIFLYGRAI